MAKPTVLIVGADKGGVGKTTVSRTVLDYFSARNVPIRAFDTEFPKGTLKRFHPDITEIVDVTQVPDQMEIFDTLSDTKVTLIDVRAGLLASSLGGIARHRISGIGQAGPDPARRVSYRWGFMKSRTSPTNFGATSAKLESGKV